MKNMDINMNALTTSLKIIRYSLFEEKNDIRSINADNRTKKKLLANSILFENILFL
jgi:hypothetical protein